MGILIWINTAKDLTAPPDMLLNPKLNFGKNTHEFLTNNLIGRDGCPFIQSVIKLNREFPLTGPNLV